MKPSEFRAVVRVLTGLIVGVWVYALIACLLILALPGCGGSTQEEEEPQTSQPVNCQANPQRCT